MTNQVLITGWRPGFEKVLLTKLLPSVAGLAPGQAKSITDQVLEGKIVTVTLESRGRAEEFAGAADKLGVATTLPANTRTGTHGYLR